MIKRVAIGVYSDGFIHAGNLAYLALLSLFPVRHRRRRGRPPVRPDRGGDGRGQRPAPDHAARRRRRAASGRSATCIEARSGSLLWLGALVGLWTTGSFIETIRDIIRRAYGVTYSRPFWEYRLGSVGMIIAAVIVAMVAFSALGPAVRRPGIRRAADPRRRRSGRPADPVAGRAGAGAVRLALPAVLRADAQALPRQRAARNGPAPPSSRSGGWRRPPCCPWRWPASAATTSPMAASPA